MSLHAKPDITAHLKRSGLLYLVAGGCIIVNLYFPRSNWGLCAAGFLWAGAVWDVWIAGSTLTREGDTIRYRIGWGRWKECNIQDIRKMTLFPAAGPTQAILEMKNKPDFIIPLGVFPNLVTKSLSKLAHQFRMSPATLSLKPQDHEARPPDESAPHCARQP